MARPSAPRRPACASPRRSLAETPRPMSARQSWSSGPLFPGRLLIWPEIATGRPPSQTVVLGPYRSIEVGQPLDPLGRKLRQRVGDAASRNDTVGDDFGQ